MSRRSVTAVLIPLAFAAALTAQSKPDFSGTWKLNVAKSDFGLLPGPESQTVVIDHKDPALQSAVSVTAAQGKQQYTTNITTDGKPSVNKMGAREVKSTAIWDGSKMVVNANLSFNDQDVTIKTIWNLSADGRTLTQNVHLASAMGETDQTLVYDKQDASTPPPATPVAPLPTQTPSPSTAPVLPAQSTGPKPNFTGVWKLNIPKSDFGVMPGPVSRTDIIEHNDPAMKLSRDENGPQGVRKYTLTLTTDGKETANDLGGAQAKLTGQWEGTALVIGFKLKLPDQDINIRQVSTLSADGQTLTTKSHVATAMGELDTVEIYDKQATP